MREGRRWRQGEERAYPPFSSLSFHVRCGSLDMDLGSGYDLWESGYNDGEVDLGCGYGMWESSQVKYILWWKTMTVSVTWSVPLSVSVSVSVSLLKDRQ